MSEEMKIIKERYSYEISKVENRLNDLEKGLISEFRNGGPYGGLSVNIQQLRKDINNIFRKIVSGKSSEIEKVFCADDESENGPNDWITKRVDKMDELTIKTELSIILQKYADVGVQGYNEEDLIMDIKKLYLNLGLDRKRR